MFTGIIQYQGKFSVTSEAASSLTAEIICPDLPLMDIQLGDSIAVNGVCLTVVSKLENGFTVDISPETLAKTSLGSLSPDETVNLELALRADSRLGGHFVSGHVDGLAELAKIAPQGEYISLTITVPDALAKYIAPKGSVCVDGISLTVNAVEGNHFTVMIIPHTQENTNLRFAKPEQQLNIEVDLLSRYMERLLECRGPDAVTTEELANEL